MPLNPQELAQQIEQQTPRLLEDSQRLGKNMSAAVDLFRRTDPHTLVQTALNATKVEQALGYPVSALQTLDEIYPIGSAPTSYSVVATDSSTIAPDRHNGTALFHVINVGKVFLRYGESPEALIESQTLFEAGDITSEEAREASSALLLSAKSSLEELKVAFEFACQHGVEVVFRDGPLNLWSSATLRDKQGSAIREEYYKVLGQFESENIPVLGYISNTHSDAVINTLQAVAKDSNDKSISFAGVQDAMLFREILGQNTRTAVFATKLQEPKELEEYIGSINFTYIKTDFEIVRVEFPRWLAEDEERLEKALALTIRQCALGQGYPVALMEAHESAVLRGTDREILRFLLEERGLLQPESEKGRSKRLRGI